MAVDLREHWPIVAAGALVVGGAVWASRTRAQQAVETTVVQPQPIDVGSIVAAQASVEQARLQAGTQLAGAFLGALQHREELRVQERLTLAQLAAQERIARIQAEAQARALQMEMELRRAEIQAQLEAQRAHAAAQQQASFFGFLGMLLPFLFLSRERTQAAAATRAYTSGGMRAQLRTTRELLRAVA